MLYKETEISPNLEIKEAIKVSLKNYEKLLTIDDEAKTNGEILYRHFSVPVNDGKAYYQITKINRRTVHINRCKGINLDEYADDILGDEHTISMSLAESRLKREDIIKDLCSEIDKEFDIGS